ncbi:LPS biosynthesis aldo/keto reductase [Candidatus Symbiothrix dinenymphae]|nr:LPS biosynthesis aldo/keto reductase [Candidatus Symbiothrix dinenymphae]
MNKLVLGTVQFGLPYGINNVNGKTSVDEVEDIINIAKARGLNTLDTSYAYGDSEVVLGKVLENDSFFKIISKIPRTEKNPKSIFQETLYRLQKKNLYGYLVHHFDYFKENPSIWADLKSLKNDGLVEKIGFSLYHPSELDFLFSQGIDFDLIQFPYNVFDRSFEPSLKELKQRNVEIHVRSVFLQGLFFRNPAELPDKLLPLSPYLNKLALFCEENKISIEELALNAVIHNKYIDGVLIGVDNAAQLNRNINSVWEKFPDEMESFISNVLNIKEKELLNPQNWNV